MIEQTLRAGLVVSMPSGNVIVLLRREKGEWLCHYALGARQRGEIYLQPAWLRKFGVVVSP